MTAKSPLACAGSQKSGSGSGIVTGCDGGPELYWARAADAKPSAMRSPRTIARARMPGSPQNRQPSAWARLFDESWLCAPSTLTLSKPIPEIAKEQCFEGKFNIYRLNHEKWEVERTVGNIYCFKNPEQGGLPSHVICIIHPFFGMIMKYAYLDGIKVTAFKLEGDCYVKDDLPPEMVKTLKELLLKLRNGYEA